MKYSTKLSDAIHILVFIAINNNDFLSSQDMAVSIQTNPSYIRQLMSKLKKANLIDTTRGAAAPILKLPADKITLYDIYKAIEGDKPLLHLDTHTNPNCGIGINIQYSISEAYDKIQQSAEKEMENITLENIINNYQTKIANI